MNSGTFTAVAYSGAITMDVHQQQWPWFAVMVKGSREKHAAHSLENAGYQCFVPLGKLSRRWSDRVKTSEVPLFRGYFFCRMDPRNRLPVLMTPGVIQIVGTGKTPTPVNEEEITAIQRLTESPLPTTPWPYLQVGNIARIEEGPLRGLSGIVVKIKSGWKLVLSVDLLQRSVAVEIDRSWISEESSAGANEMRHDSSQTVCHGIAFDKSKEISELYRKAS